MATKPKTSSAAYNQNGYDAGFNTNTNPLLQMPTNTKIVNGINLAPIPTGSVANPFTGGAKTIPTYGAPAPVVKTAPVVVPKATTQTSQTRTATSPSGGISIPAGYVNIGTLQAPNIVPAGGRGSATTPPPVTTGSTTTTPAPGSAGYIYQQSAQDAAAEKQYKNIGKYYDEEFNQSIDPNQIYQATLARYQAQIDSINNMFNDQLNNSRITNAPTYKAREDQGRIGQVMGGLVGSPMGQAQTNNVQNANAEEQAAAEAIINDKREVAISAVFGKARESAEAELTAKRAAKAKGADELLKFLNEAPTRKKAKLSSVVKSLIAQGVDVNELSPEELDKITKDMGVSGDDLISAYAEGAAEQKEAEQKSAKAQLEQDKLSAEIENLEGKYEFEAAQKALDRALEEKRISVSWYNAATSRMGENRQAAESADKKAQKNYDGATIPEDVKSELIFDLQQNSASKKKERKTLQEFFATYPEVNTKYLSELYESNN